MENFLIKINNMENQINLKTSWTNIYILYLLPLQLFLLRVANIFTHTNKNMLETFIMGRFNKILNYIF